jgi:hypothetical protein
MLYNRRELNLGSSKHEEEAPGIEPWHSIVLCIPFMSEFMSLSPCYNREISGHMGFNVTHTHTKQRSGMNTDESTET